MSLLEDVAEKLRRRGYSVEVSGERLTAKHPNAPIYIVVESGATWSVRVESRGFRDYVDDVRESEEDPRSFLEEVLEDVERAANEVVTMLRSKGINVSSSVRNDVLDLLDALEDVLES